MSNSTEVDVTHQVEEIKSSWWFFPSYFWAICLILGSITTLYFDYAVYKIIGFIISLYCVTQLGYRSGLIYGYIRGYESGLECSNIKTLE